MVWHGDSLYHSGAGCERECGGSPRLSSHHPKVDFRRKTQSEWNEVVASGPRNMGFQIFQVAPHAGPATSCWASSQCCLLCNISRLRFLLKIYCMNIKMSSHFAPLPLPTESSCCHRPLTGGNGFKSVVCWWYQVKQGLLVLPGSCERFPPSQQREAKHPSSVRGIISVTSLLSDTLVSDADQEGACSCRGAVGRPCSLEGAGLLPAPPLCKQLAPCSSRRVHLHVCCWARAGWDWAAAILCHLFLGPWPGPFLWQLWFEISSPASLPVLSSTPRCSQTHRQALQVMGFLLLLHALFGLTHA